MFSFNLFGKKPSQPVHTDNDDNIISVDIILNLKSKVELLEKKNNFLELKTKNITDDVRKIATTNKKGALILLNKKKDMDLEIQKNIGIITIIEKQISSLESATINLDVFKTMKMGQKIIKKSQENINIDKIEDLMDEIEEQRETTQTISNMFSQRVDLIYEDEDLLAELDELKEEIKMEKEILPILLPEVPKNKIVKEDKIQEEQILTRILTEMMN